MKRSYLIGASFLLMCGLILCAFGTAYAKGPKLLQYEYWLPPKTPEYPVMQAFYKGLEDATEGAVKVQFNPGGAMGKPGGTYQRTLQGVNNIGHFNPGFTTGVFPMWEIFDYPVRAPNSEQLARFQIEMYEKGYFDKDFADVKVTALFNIGSYIIFSNKKVDTLADLKGLKIRTIGEGWVALSKAVGAVPVSLPTGEIYAALQKGIIDAVAIVWDASHVFKLNEVSKYVNEIYLMSGTHIEAWNKKSWEALPQAGKDYVNANWKQYSIDCAKTYDDLESKFQQEFLDTGSDREIGTFSAEEAEKLDQRATPIWEKWIADREKKGLPAKKALDDLYQIMTEAGQKNPIAGYTP